MADAQTAEAKELALVGKVEMRIALASSEKKLEDLLKVYLAPLLLKLGSEHVAVRNKVGISHYTLTKHPMHAFPPASSTANAVFLYRSSLFANTSTPASSHSTHLALFQVTWSVKTDFAVETSSFLSQLSSSSTRKTQMSH
jgi:hypothetical protein